MEQMKCPKCKRIQMASDGDICMGCLGHKFRSSNAFDDMFKDILDPERRAAKADERVQEAIDRVNKRKK